MLSRRNDSNVSDRFAAGMHGFVDVTKCEEFKEPVRRMTVLQQRQSREWKYYIAAEEIVWDYSKDNNKHIDQ